MKGYSTEFLTIKIMILLKSCIVICYFFLIDQKFYDVIEKSFFIDNRYRFVVDENEYLWSSFAQSLTIVPGNDGYI